MFAGLDIPNVEHVVHYQVPRTSESYVHRSGRTARATKQGLSLLLADASEQVLLRKLCQSLARGGKGRARLRALIIRVLLLLRC